MKALKFAASAAAVVLTVGAVPITSFLTNPERIQHITAAAEVFGVFEYENYGSYIEITKYTGSATEVEIPDNIDGIPVTAIADGRFYNGYTYEGAFLDTKVVSVTIPESVTKIGDYAFRWCSSLASIEFSDNITEIGKSAFYNCDSLTSVVIPDSVETLGVDVFADCDNLNTVTVGAKSIGAGAFYGTPKLTSVTITDNVYSIGDAAFVECTSLETIAFPDSVKEMGGGMFYGCSSLKKVTLPKEITSLSYWNRYGFFERCTSLKEIVIPYYVTSIGTNCFSNVPLESVTIGARLTDFTNLPLDCETLKEIIVVDENRNYSSVDGVLFNKDQTELIKYPKAKADEEYTVPETVASVAKNAFNGNSSIKKVTLPENVTNIYGSSFYKCAKLEDIIFMNPKCEIYDYSDTIDDNAYINGYTGSTAEAYANKYNKQFVSMGSAPSETTTAVTTTSSQTTTTTAETTTPAVTTTPDVLYGDINEDGTVDASDASLILAYYAYVQTGGKDGLKDFRDNVE